MSDANRNRSRMVGVRPSIRGHAALALAALVVALCRMASAQTPLSDLVFCAGTTAQDTNSQWWSYVVIGSEQPQLLAGKTFAVYGKTGYATNSGTFALHGTLSQQNDVNTINTLLNQSVSLGEDLGSLSNSLNILFHTIPGISNQPVAQKVVSAFQESVSDPVGVQTVLLLSRGHPGLARCSGMAFAEPVTTVTTYEIREVNAGTGTAGDVLGRVTVVPGAPIVLPAPGAPFQVSSNGLLDHLRIRLRWGTPDSLRRLALLNYGFNIWRIPRAAAEAAGYQVAPPTLAQLYSDANFTRANNSAVNAGKDFSMGSGAGAADDPADRVTSFFSDDNRARFGGSPFNDGDEFYYFVTARDLLGRDGLVSQGGLARACRKARPATPTGIRVENVVMNTNESRLLVSWAQNTNSADAISEYWVYRWPNPAMALTNDVAPASNRVGVVAQAPGTNNSLLDNGGGAPQVAGASNFWYTVRAVSQGACSPLLSAQSAPAWGVLRERSGPDAATGNVQGSCGTPVVAFQTLNTLTNSADTNSANYNYRFTCARRDPGIAWVQFAFVDRFNSKTDTLAQIYFSPDENQLQADYAFPSTALNNTNDVLCTVGTFYGLTSSSAIAHFSGSFPPTQIKEAVFLAGELLETALSSSDPLLAALSGNSVHCIPNDTATVDASGTVGLTFNVAAGMPLLIEVLQSNLWADLGVHTPDSSNVYWVSYPPCTVGVTPPFQGCIVSLSGSNGDCDQHISRAADDGPVAPLHIRFNLTARTHEYRLYRSVNDGPLTLLAAGAAVFNPLLPNRQIARTDDAMPSSGSRLCYFVQTLDEHGNGSPLAFLGCKEVKPAKLPRPVLAEPQATGTTGDPQVTLNWFCPTSGVYRFQLKIERADQPGSGLATGFSSSRLLRMASYNSASRYAGLNRFATAVQGRSVASFLRFDEAHLTPPVGISFGPGPQFSLAASVVANVPYNISVAAVDGQGNVGDSSPVWKFTWKPPVVLASVPWPARPMPPVNNFDSDLDPAPLLPFYPRVQAVLMTDGNYSLDQRSPVGIAIGYLDNVQNYTSNVRTLGYGSYTTRIGTQGQNPHELVFHRLSGDPSRRGDSLLPCVLYREQLTNAAFPRVSGHMTQVSPLIERLPWTNSVCTDCGTTTVTLCDRLLAIVWKFDQLNTYRLHVMLCVRDQQPVILGARYRYFLARFDQKHELAEVIPAGELTVPTDPNAAVPAQGVP